jgi:hypothetical protein
MSSASSLSPLLRSSLLAVAFAVIAMWTAPAHAAPAGGSASFSTKDGAKSSGSGFEWPELVVAGNAISFIAPFQIGAVGYLPKARFGFQYDRQVRRAHWVHFGAALLADRAGFKNFRMDACGLETQSAACDKGGVVGFDLYAGYAYKFYLPKKPYIVPIVRGSVGFSWWALPKVGNGDADREQTRTKSWTLNVRPGAGVRIFLLQELALGADINIPLGFLVHTNVPLAGDRDRSGGFLLGFEILPVVVEYRF